MTEGKGTLELAHSGLQFTNEKTIQDSGRSTQLLRSAHTHTHGPGHPHNQVAASVCAIFIHSGVQVLAVTHWTVTFPFLIELIEPHSSK